MDFVYMGNYLKVKMPTTLVESDYNRRCDVCEQVRHSMFCSDCGNKTSARMTEQRKSLSDILWNIYPEDYFTIHEVDDYEVVLPHIGQFGKFLDLEQVEESKIPENQKRYEYDRLITELKEIPYEMCYGAITIIGD